MSYYTPQHSRTLDLQLGPDPSQPSAETHELREAVKTMGRLRTRGWESEHMDEWAEDRLEEWERYLEGLPEEDRFNQRGFDDPSYSERLERLDKASSLFHDRSEEIYQSSSNNSHKSHKERKRHNLKEQKAMEAKFISDYKPVLEDMSHEDWGEHHQSGWKAYLAATANGTQVSGPWTKDQNTFREHLEGLSDATQKLYPQTQRPSHSEQEGASDSTQHAPRSHHSEHHHRNEGAHKKHSSRSGGSSLFGRWGKRKEGYKEVRSEDRR